MEKLWKLTSSIEKPDQPISSIRNPSKSLSTIEKQWKTLSSVRNSIAQFSLEIRETFMETVCWYILLNKVFVYEICLEVVWASSKNLCKLIGSPYTSFLFNRESVKNNFVNGESRKTISRTKNSKLQSLKRKHSKIIFIEKKTVWIDFKQKDPCKKTLKKNEVNLIYWGTQENKLSAMVTPWEKKCFLEFHWNQFHYWK